MQLRLNEKGQLVVMSYMAMMHSRSQYHGTTCRKSRDEYAAETDDLTATTDALVKVVHSKRDTAVIA
jgi:hypothetical protein